MSDIIPKSYVAYTLYGFLKTWKEWPEGHDRLPGDGRGIAFPHLDAAARQLRSPRKGHARFALSPAELARQRIAMARQLGIDFSRQRLARTFGAHRDDFTDASIEVIGHRDEPRSDATSAPRKARTMHGPSDLSIEYDGEHVTMIAGRTLASLSTSDLEHTVAKRYASFLLEDRLPEPFALCAERFAISLLHRELGLAKIRPADPIRSVWNTTSPIDSRVTGRYALPIKDNIEHTRNIPGREKGKSDPSESRRLDTIKDMMKGDYEAKEDEIRFISRSRADEHSFDIPLHIASSSSRGLSDLYFYLRHTETERTNHLLIIDEPESHLDTANQIRLARLLAQLVKTGRKGQKGRKSRKSRKGTKVLITTHSDYLVKEINNLVMLSNPMPGKEEIIGQLGYDPSDWIRPESIRAYVAREHDLRQCSVGRLGIDMTAFDQTIDRIHMAANDLTNRLTMDCGRSSARTIGSGKNESDLPNRDQDERSKPKTHDNDTE